MLGHPAPLLSRLHLAHLISERERARARAREREAQAHIHAHACTDPEVQRGTHSKLAMATSSSLEVHDARELFRVEGSTANQTSVDIGHAHELVHRLRARTHTHTNTTREHTHTRHAFSGAGHTSNTETATGSRRTLAPACATAPRLGMLPLT